jgi:hypothetical protein
VTHARSGDLAHVRCGGKAIVLPLRGDRMPTEAERGTAPVGSHGGGASVATTATLPEPAFGSRGFCPVGSGSLQLPVGGLTRVIFLDGATA